MKKLIILLLLISSNCFAQFDLIKNQTNGLYSKAQNNATFMGVSSGSSTMPVSFDVNGSIDTNVWGLMLNNGNYGQAYNKVTFMGVSANGIRIPVQFGANSVSGSSGNTFSGNNTFTGNNIFSNGNDFTDSIRTNIQIGDTSKFNVLFVGGVQYVAPTNTDTSLLVHKSSFSQSIEASGGIFNLISASEDFPMGAEIHLSAEEGFTFTYGGNQFYLTSIFGDATTSAVTPATMQTVTLTINGVTHEFYIKNE